MKGRQHGGRKLRRAGREQQAEHGRGGVMMGDGQQQQQQQQQQQRQRPARNADLPDANLQNAKCQPDGGWGTGSLADSDGAMHSRRACAGAGWPCRYRDGSLAIVALAVRAAFP